MTDDNSKTLMTPGPPGTYEPCEECGAPMDAQQRYCINCAARRGNGANPSSRYFAAMSKKARRPLTGPARKPAPTSRAAAVAFFALLPIAVALGVVVGRSGSGGEDNSALLQALRQQESASVASTGTGTGTSSTSKKAKKDGGKPKSKKGEKEAEKKSVVAHTKNGDIHELTTFEASKEKEEEDTKLVEENPEQVGKTYIKAQQNLGDVTVVGGDGSSSSGSLGGAEP